MFYVIEWYWVQSEKSKLNRESESRYSLIIKIYLKYICNKMRKKTCVI